MSKRKAGKQSNSCGTSSALFCYLAAHLTRTRSYFQMPACAHGRAQICFPVLEFSEKAKAILSNQMNRESWFGWCVKWISQILLTRGTARPAYVAVAWQPRRKPLEPRNFIRFNASTV
jgi:hypothetical protein